MVDPIPSTQQASHIPSSPAAAPAPTPTATPAAPANPPVAAPAPAAAPVAAAAPAPAASAAPVASTPGGTTLLGGALDGMVEWKPPQELGALDAEVKKALDGWAGKNKFSAEQANTIFDVAPAVLQFVERQQVAAFKAEQAAWKEAVQKEHGAAFKQVEADAVAFVRRYGDRELVSFLEDYGGGNHPAVMRSFAKATQDVAEAQREIVRLKTIIKERMSEDTSSLESGSKSGATGPAKTPQQILYDHPSSRPAAR